MGGVFFKKRKMVGVFFLKIWKVGVFFCKKKWKIGGCFFVKMWTYPQRRVHYVQYQYFLFLHFTYLGAVRTHPTHPPAYRSGLERWTRDSERSRVRLTAVPLSGNNLGQVVHTRASGHRYR